MTFNDLYTFSLSLPGATEDFPFGEETLVFKVSGKMFGLVGLENVPPRMNLKCDPERALELRASYEGIEPGWHMNKTNWNSVYLASDVPGDLIRELARHSYDLIVDSLPKARRPRPNP